MKSKEKVDKQINEESKTSKISYYSKTISKEEFQKVFDESVKKFEKENAIKLIDLLNYEKN